MPPFFQGAAVRIGEKRSSSRSIQRFLISSSVGGVVVNVTNGTSSMTARGVCSFPSPMTNTALAASPSRMLALVILSFLPNISGVFM